MENAIRVMGKLVTYVNVKLDGMDNVVSVGVCVCGVTCVGEWRMLSFTHGLLFLGRPLGKT